MATYEEFSNWLQEELNKRGWDQAELARRGRVNPAQISRLMSGERRPGPTTCAAIARALVIPPEEVFRRAGLLPRQTGPSDRTEELLYHFNSLSDEDQQRLVTIARAFHEQAGE